QVDVGVDDVDMPREQVAHSPLQGRADFPLRAPEPQEAEGARRIDRGRERFALERSWLGASLDREANVGVNALEQLAVEGRQCDPPRLLVEGPVGAERGCASSRRLTAESAHRRLRRKHAELEGRLAVAVRTLGALAEGMDGDGI